MVFVYDNTSYIKQFRFQAFYYRTVMADSLLGYRRNSQGWQKDPVASVHPLILFGAGETLTPEFVKKYGITHVINCAFPEDSPSWFSSKFPENYECLCAVDSLDEDITRWYSQFEFVMNNFLRSRDATKIYVHCQCGINRSGFLTLIYICKKFGYEFDLAVRSIVKQRPCALTNPSYMIQAREYIKNLS
jgi:hypothetical protein